MTQTSQMRPSVEVESTENYRFKITFPESNSILYMDEPQPLGNATGPNASRVLSAAVANCLSASLLFCLRKSKVPVKNIRAEASPTLTRNNEGYWRVSKIDIRIIPELEESETPERTQKCLDIFEKYCIVTEAVRNGIEINVNVDYGNQSNSTEDSSCKL